MIEFLVWFVACFMSTMGFTYLYYKLLDADRKINIYVILVFIVGVFLITIVKSHNFSLLTAILYFLYFPILFYLIKSVSFGKMIYYLVIIWIYAIFLDFISMILFLPFHFAFGIDIYGEVACILMSAFVFVALIIMARSKKVKKITNNLYKKVSKVNYFDFALISFAVFVLLTGVAVFLNLDNLSLSILLMAIIILLSFSFILLIRVRIHLVENAIFLDLLKANNAFYIKIEDENRIFKHNLMAKMLAIKSVSGSKARKLIDEFVGSFNKDMDFSVHIKDLPYGLNGIIYEKIYPYIGKIYIKISNKIDFDIFSKLKPRRYNVFVEKIIIALDNAIESCMESHDKLLIVNLYFEDSNIIVDIKNTFSSDINLDEVGKVNYSTKGKKRGLGLFSALRDNEVEMSVKIINNWFVSKIVAKQNNVEDAEL